MELDRYEKELRQAGKARNTITTYVQHPERFINWLVGRYEMRPASMANPSTDGSMRPNSKYEPLRAYLATHHDPVIIMTFTQIESVLGFALPPSARRYRPWWGNEKSGTHVHARAWLDAGFKTGKVDLNAGTVQFVI